VRSAAGERGGEEDIALLIYKAQHVRENRKQEQTTQQETKIADQKRNVEAAAAHAQFVNQYVNANFNRTPGIPLVAVAVAAENKTMNRLMSTVLISRFKGEHAQLVDSFFKPPLLSDNLFNDAFNGSSALFNKLVITNSVEALLLARQTVEYSTSAELDNVITATIRHATRRAEARGN
jgi:hypothetical protein